MLCLFNSLSFKPALVPTAVRSWKHCKYTFFALSLSFMAFLAIDSISFSVVFCFFISSFFSIDNFFLCISSSTFCTEDRALFNKMRFHTLILDEAHMLKNMASLRYENLMKIKAYLRILLTGTPWWNSRQSSSSWCPNYLTVKKNLKEVATRITPRCPKETLYSDPRYSGSSGVDVNYTSPHVVRRTLRSAS